MKIQLGSKKEVSQKSDNRQTKKNNDRITAKSDGGLSLYIDRDSSCSYPVFSLEVASNFRSDADDEAKRKKHKFLHSETVHQRHGAQIYAKMLGQLCHAKLYGLNLSGYQEVKSCSICY